MTKRRTLRRTAVPRWLPAAIASFGLVVASGLTRPVRADDTKAQAQALFESGLALQKQGNWPEACAKLEESQKLDPQPGTLFFVADCQEHTNKLASAWANFISVADKAEGLHKMAHAKEARGRADALRVRLTKILLLLPDELRNAPGLQVRRNNVEIGAALFGVPLPVDAGKHVIEVSATGRRTWTTTVEAAGEGATLSVSIPPLKEEPQVGPVATIAPTAAPAANTETPDEAPWSTPRKVALGLGVVGVVGVAVGAVFGGLAADKAGAASRECTPGSAGAPATCSAAGGELREQTDSLATSANVGLIAGGALAATGLVVWLVAPPGSKAKAAEPRARVAVSTDGRGAAFKLTANW